MRLNSGQHKALYQAMKAAAKARKIKLSAERDLYKRTDPYFYDTFWWPEEMASGRIGMTLDITVKYCRFDELQYGILCPGEEARFTDKLRANSGMLCRAAFPRMTQHFDFDGSEAAMPGLCEDLLDFLRDYCAGFLAMVEETYGDLDGYYIAHRDTMPRLAGLAFLDRGDAAGAADCFSQPNMDGENSTWWVPVETEEQPGGPWPAGPVSASTRSTPPSTATARTSSGTMPPPCAPGWSGRGTGRCSACCPRSGPRAG